MIRSMITDWLEDINLLIIIHLGKKPVKGGNPARDNSKILKHTSKDLDDKIELNI